MAMKYIGFENGEISSILFEQLEPYSSIVFISWFSV